MWHIMHYIYYITFIDSDDRSAQQFTHFFVVFDFNDANFRGTYILDYWQSGRQALL